MAKAKLVLPTVINKDAWFYEENKEVLEPHLGKPYISYSSVNSWTNPKYKMDFIKKKLLGIPDPPNIYADFGSYVGEALETGKWPEENPHGFTGQENFQVFLDDRPPKAEYEKLIVIDRGAYIIIGFIDVFLPDEDGDIVMDLKTGGANKEAEYESEDYVQVILYAHALEELGHTIKQTAVYFVRREGSHRNPPMKISEEQFFIDLDYTPERIEFALSKVDKAVQEISSCLKTYQKLVA